MKVTSFSRTQQHCSFNSTLISFILAYYFIVYMYLHFIISLIYLFINSQLVVLHHSSLYLSSCLQTDKLLKPSKLVEVSVGGGVARLTLPHLAKDDEGLYTLRIFTKDGTTEHSAYLFVSGTSLGIDKSHTHTTLILEISKLGHIFLEISWIALLE